MVSPDSDELSATVRRDGARSSVTIAGELDLTTIEPLRALLREAAAEGVERIEVDSTGVTYLDSVVLAMFLAFQVNAPKEGAELRIVAASDEFTRIVTLAGLGDALLPEAGAETGAEAGAEAGSETGTQASAED